MNDEVKRCVKDCRKWYQAFCIYGKGGVYSVESLNIAADLIESLAAELEQVKRERDAYFESMKGLCATCKKAQFCILSPVSSVCWEWRGVKEE